MQRLKIFLAYLFSIVCICPAVAFTMDISKKKAIVIIVDGIPADLIERTATPYIDALAKKGGYTRAYMGGERGSYSQTPTISAVCYTSMITGTWVNKHRVWNNNLENPNYNYWTFYRFVREARPEAKLGIYSTWLDNRTKLVGEGKEATNHLKIDIHYDGYEHDTIQYPHDAMSMYIQAIDERVVQEASGSIRRDAPDFSWVYLQYTDDAGHRYGDGEGMIDAIKKADHQVGELCRAVSFREQNYEEDWLIIVITDHGRDVATGFGHGGQSERERTIWMATNAKNLNKHFYAHTPAIVDILPSMARHLDIPIAQSKERELDGVPFIGPVSLSDARASIKGDKLLLEWTAFEREGEVDVAIACSNAFKEGAEDRYMDLGKVALGKGRAEVSLPEGWQNMPFYKVVLQGKHNTINRWILKD